MQKLFTAFIFSFLFSSSFAQDGLGYYYDYNNHFYVFDKGNNIQLESNHVDSIRAGIDYLAYIDYRGYLRVYYKGETQTIEEDLPSVMIATPYALVYKMAQRLMVFEHGEKKQLARAVYQFDAQENLVTWVDLSSIYIYAYENGQINIIEKSVSANVIKSGLTGINIYAYSDVSNNFKIYYAGQVYETGSTNITDYQCGKNIVAYIDGFNNTFNVFYNNKSRVISDHIPKSYSVAANMVSYVDYDDNFMLYYNGTILPLESWVPAVQNARNNIIEYYNNTDLKIIYGGKNYTVDRFIPDQRILLGPNSALYLDNNHRPKYFYKGKIAIDFLTEQVNDMYLIWDLPVFRYGTNTIGFYYNGKIYDYETNKY